MPPIHNTSWEESRQHVSSELDRLSRGQDKIVTALDKQTDSIFGKLEEVKDSLTAKMGGMSVDIAMLQVKAGVWGAVGGAIPVAVGLLVWFFKK